ncbi:MAG: TolC family protein [Campylobacterales bacterium]|nr:TolC family protein [Campylobacterales bacterium]
MNIRFFCVGFFVLFLVGCSQKHDGYTIDVNTSGSWDLSMKSKKDSIADKFDDTKWWSSFGDKILLSLIDKGIKNNKDLKIARLNVKTARAMQDVASSGFYPKVNADASLQHQGVSKYSGMVLPGMPMDKNVFSVGFDASWEIDIFGGVRNSVDAASAKADALNEDAKWTMVSVCSEIAKNYISYKSAVNRQNIAQQKVDIQKEILEIIKQKQKIGDASEFELIRAKSTLYSMQSALAQANLDARLLIYRLSVLVGETPDALVGELAGVQTATNEPLDIVPVGLRSDILKRRPDIKSALDNLKSKNSELKAADADFFPKFYLTGSVSSQTLSFADLFKAGSGAWSVGPVLNWPIFRGGEIAAMVRAKDSETQIAAAIYEKSVLNALEDAESALSRYAQDMSSHRFTKKSFDEGQKNLFLSKRRFEIGESDKIAYLEAKQNMLNTQDVTEQSRLKVFLDLVSLYKALGGDFRNIN